jgi:hypothetical protein
MSLWLKLSESYEDKPKDSLNKTEVNRLGDTTSWGILRAVRYHSRPAHADQLHVDLWWNGINVARDAGTYRYTSPTPWNNALASTMVHNTITIDEQDQMFQAGRFLWLGWAQAKLIKKDLIGNLIIAEHYGYQKKHILHRRSVQWLAPDRWRISDTIIISKKLKETKKVKIHWLLPDWDWSFEKGILQLTHHGYKLKIAITSTLNSETKNGFPIIQLIRAGKVIMGTEDQVPNLGWYSPTYNSLEPALSLRVSYSSAHSFSIITDWFLG